MRCGDCPCERLTGYTFSKARTSEIHDLTMPADAQLAERIARRGAHNDGFYLFDSFTNRLARGGLALENPVWIQTDGTITVRSPAPGIPPQSPAAAETYSIDREFDAHSRLVRHGDTYYTYAPDGLLATISDAEAIVEYAYTPDRLDAGYTLTLTNGTVFTRSVVRDVYRRSLITAITNSVNGIPVEILSYAYDALGRPVTRNEDTFAYNNRSEVVSATIAGGSPSPATASYGYDDIGNSTNWPANCLGKRTLIASAMRKGGRPFLGGRSARGRRQSRNRS